MPPALSFATRSAIAWRIIDGINRRPRPGVDLRAMILMPGDGQYFCVSLIDCKRWKPALMMNLHGSSLVVHPIGTPRAEEANLRWATTGYQAGVLAHGADPMVDDIEALLGLPVWKSGQARVTPAMLGIRLIAGVMQRRIFADEGFVATPGYFDSSGMGGSYVAPWLGVFPELKAPTNEASGGDDPMRRGMRAWRIHRQGDESHEVFLDLGTGEAVATGKHPERVQLFRWYTSNGYKLGPLIDWTVDHLEGR